MISICQGKMVNNIFHRNGYYQYYDYTFSNTVMAEYHGILYNKNYFCYSRYSSRSTGYEVREYVNKSYNLSYIL